MFEACSQLNLRAQPLAYELLGWIYDIKKRLEFWNFCDKTYIGTYFNDKNKMKTN